MRGKLSCPGIDTSALAKNRACDFLISVPHLTNLTAHMLHLSLFYCDFRVAVKEIGGIITDPKSGSQINLNRLSEVK